MKFLLVTLAIFVSCITFSQTSYIYADSTKLAGRGAGSNELILENSTKTIKGFLYNYTGNGRTKYKLAVDTITALTDSTARVRFSDASTFDIKIRGTSRVDTAISVNDSTLRIYKNGSSFDVKIRGTKRVDT